MNAPTLAAQPAVHCLLCALWRRMPHAARYTTPTTAQDTENAMVAGYWTASRGGQGARFCERHGAMLETMDLQEAARAEAEAALRAAEPSSDYEVKRAAIRARAEALLKAVHGAPPVPPLMIPPIAPLAPAASTPQPTSFVLGPGPLLNGQTTPPNLGPVAPPLAAIEPMAPPVPNAEPPASVDASAGPLRCGSCGIRCARAHDMVEHIKHDHPSPGELPLQEG